MNNVEVVSMPLERVDIENQPVLLPSKTKKGSANSNVACMSDGLEGQQTSRRET